MEAISKIAAVSSTSNSQSLKRQASESRIEGLKIALGKFAILRGEVMDAMRLESYSKALAEEFDDADILVVLGKMVRQPRAEFEPKIPELGNMLGLVRERRTARLAKAEQARRDAEHDAYLRDLAEHPENYVSWAVIVAEAQAKVAGKKHQEAPPPVTHTTTTEELGNGVYRQTCTCGKKWETIGPVPTCMGVNAKQHAQESLEGIVNAKETAA